MQEARELLSLLGEHSSDGLVVHQNGCIISINKAALSLLRYPHADAVLGQAFLQLIHPAHRASVSGHGQEHVSGRLDLLSRMGEPVTVHLSGFPVHFDGTPAMLSLLRPLSGTQRLQDREDRLNQLQTASATIDVLVHRMRDPLSFASSNIGVSVDELREISEDLGPEHPLLAKRLNETIESLKEAQEGVRRLQVISEELERLIRGSDARREALDPRKVLDTLVQRLEGELSLRARVLRDYQPVPLVEANASRLQRLFQNLIQNALDALPTTQSETHCLLLRTATTANGACLVEIIDDGPGFPPELREHLFEPFFTTRPGAAGLGLSVCRGLAESLGGRVEIHDASPGVRAQVILPAHNRRASGGSRTARVLVVDDEPMVGSALRRILGSNNETTVISDAREALSLIRNGRRFDIVFCDLRMPHLSGQDLYQALLSIAPEQADRLIFMTGDSERQEHQAFLQRIPNTYIEKPLDIQRVRELVMYSLR